MDQWPQILNRKTARTDTKVFVSSVPSKNVANCSNLNINWMTTNGSTPERHCMFVAQGTVWRDLQPKELILTMKRNIIWRAERTLFVIMLKMGRFVAKIFNGKNYLSSTSMDISERSWWHTVEKVITGQTLVNITKIVVIHAKQKWKRTHLSIGLMSNKQNCGHSTTCFRNIK